MNKRYLVIGDIHGAFNLFKECLELCKFNKNNDTIILIGDLVDGNLYSFELIEYLISIKDNIIFIRGNHDEFLIKFFNENKHGCDWNHGGYTTLASYIRNLNNINDAKFNYMFDRNIDGFITNLNNTDIPKSHIDFFNSSIPFLELDGNLFVHGGYDYKLDINDYDNRFDIISWDRTLIEKAMLYHDYGVNKLGKYENIFIGHTNTYSLTGKNDVMFKCNVINIDTGAGGYGCLCVMDVETKEYWLSSNNELHII